MGKHELCRMSGVVYDVESSEYIRQPDVAELEKFCLCNDHHNMCITYESAFECKKRRGCLYAWLVKHGFDAKHRIAVRENKLYVFKEKE